VRSASRHHHVVDRRRQSREEVLQRPIGGVKGYGPLCTDIPPSFSTVFPPAGGDLLIMQGRCQRDWRHCVPKQKIQAGARMSLKLSSITQS
jgi:hypothetical protein